MSPATENPSARAEQTDWMCSALAERLREEGAPDLARTLEACNTEMPMRCGQCGHRKIGHTQCRRRWCPRCQRIISAQRVQRFRQGVALMQWPLSIMLSHQNEDHAHNSFRTLMPAFKRFRRTKIWKNNVKGGLVSYEVTNRFGTWHDHLHALVDCRWLALETPEWRKTNTAAANRKLLKQAHAELSSAWASCLDQEEAVTWVDRATGGRLMEHIKYTVKASDLLACTGRIAPLLRAMKGRRLVQPFGSLYGLSKQWKKDDDDQRQQCKCPSCQATSSFIPEFVVEATIRRSQEQPGAKRASPRRWH